MRRLGAWGGLDGCRALLLLEDGVVAEAFALRLFAVVAGRMGLVALGQRCHVRATEGAWNDGWCRVGGMDTSEKQQLGREAEMVGSASDGGAAWRPMALSLASPETKGDKAR